MLRLTCYGVKHGAIPQWQKLLGTVNGDRFRGFGPGTLAVVRVISFPQLDDRLRMELHLCVDVSGHADCVAMINVINPFPGFPQAPRMRRHPLLRRTAFGRVIKKGEIRVIADDVAFSG